MVHAVKGPVKSGIVPLKSGVAVYVNRSAYFRRYPGQREFLTVQFIIMVIKVMH
jgi:hypothetical protein